MVMKMIEQWDDLKKEPVDSSNSGEYIQKKVNPIERLLHPGARQNNTFKAITIKEAFKRHGIHVKE